MRSVYIIIICDDVDYSSYLQVAQYGRTKKIALEKTMNKGWGVIAMEPIPAGSFLGVYSGELLLPCELEVREAYVLVVPSLFQAS